MLSDDIAISVRNLTKTYRLFAHPGDRVKQAATFGLRKYYKEFTALKDVSFDIKKGETVGIIGRNGSGKSTLLQVICGILKPTSGTVQVNGRVSALLELGAGFNPEFTGRENVYFQGALMGFTREQMAERFDDIAAFADIGAFIDQPVRMYSSGMYIRLAFAVVAHVEPSILVVDEALAVGDLAYQVKCMNHIQRLVDEGVTLFLVSHNIYHVNRMCRRCLFMERGDIRMDGDADVVTNVYESELLRGIASIAQPGLQVHGFRFRSVGISGIGIRKNEIGYSLLMASPFAVEIAYELNQLVINGLQIGVVIKDRGGSTIFGLTTSYSGSQPPGKPGFHLARVIFEPNILLPGFFSISVSAFDACYKTQFGFWEMATNLEILPSESFCKLQAIGCAALPNRWEFMSKSVASRGLVFAQLHQE